MPVKSSINKGWADQLLKHLEIGLIEEVTDIHRRATILAPHASGDLKASGKIARTGTLEYTLSYGSARVPYARKRHFENRKNPQTIGYLAMAGDAVARGDQGKYFRNKV